MTTTMRSTARILNDVSMCIGAALAMLFSGCSSTNGPDGSSTTEPIPAASTTLAVTAIEFGYDTTTWAVPVSTPITITLTNDGTIPHEWAVLKVGVHIDNQAQFREDMVLFEVEALKEGTSATQKFSLDEPGPYQIICAIQGHLDAGMSGKITALS